LQCEANITDNTWCPVAGFRSLKFFLAMAAHFKTRVYQLDYVAAFLQSPVGADDASVLILWTKLFLVEQGYTVNDNILFQDNKSTILLQENGKKSSGSRTGALNIRYFFINDQVEKGNVRIVHCPTGEMVANYLTKPLQGKTFTYLKKKLMGHD
jgi:hypothetical protein